MPFDDLGALINQLNIHDDAIIMDSKIRDLADYFQNVFEDEQQLKDVLQQFNRLALDDSKFAMNLALFFASRILDSAVQSGSQVRAEMLTILQQNYMDADRLKSTNRTHFYNSITLLGEYYHRARIAASPVQILGQSLLQLLADHLRADIDLHLSDAAHRPDVRYAKLILRQITLNGQLARTNHKAEIETLLFEIRRCLVLVADLCSTTRALLLMTLDLYYSNFGNLGAALEALYVTYLTDENDTGAPAPTASTVQIGLQAATAETTINSLTGLSGELRKQGSGYQRPPGIKTEFLNRPLRAADRLRFVRQQTASDLEQDNEAFREQQRSFEQTVQQQQQQRAQHQPASQLSPVSNSNEVPEPEIRPNLTPTKSTNQPPPSTDCSPTSTTTMAANTNPNLNHSPRSVPGSPGANSTPSTPTKTPTARRRPLFVPVSPPQNSDWFAEVESHFALSVQQSLADQEESLPLSPPENRKNHGNGSPNKYSKSLSPAGNAQATRANGHAFSHSHDGENSGQPMSPTKVPHRNQRGGRKNHNRRNNERQHNNDGDSMYASKGSLQSLRHTGNNGEHRSGQRNNNASNQHGTQLKPANRNNNPFDRRSNKPSSSVHSQHCDRGEMPTKYERHGGSAPSHHSDDQVNSPPSQPARNPHAAQYAREFLQFLED